ncbi:hypothetical protein HGRIS_013945 [Hohenbuehelia grisea]|uniref:Peptidase M43 pregnancy-associated plasma-A domain-containing protein n=1 Tax=Hohenbuehelia grisea TaxID=104357 RepID=A0ABR3JTA2_9AGAR
MLSITVVSVSLSAIIALAGPVKQLGTSLGCVTPVLPDERTWNIPYQEGLAPVELPNVGSRVKVHWHVIMRNNTAAGGNIEDSLIATQMDILNHDYASTELSFELVNTTRTLNPEWFSEMEPISGLEYQMKTELTPRDDPSELHIYTLDASWVTMSEKTTPTRAVHGLDGVVLMVAALPGSLSSGHILTHEVGHWSGLRHTFYTPPGQTSCSSNPADGDGVSDTPPQLKRSDRCDQLAHSCGPENPPDATDNYMNYVPDECRKQFTPGQIERMRKFLKEARGITMGSPVGVTTKPTKVTHDRTRTKTRGSGRSGQIVGPHTGCRRPSSYRKPSYQRPATCRRHPSHRSRPPSHRYHPSRHRPTSPRRLPSSCKPISHRRLRGHSRGHSHRRPLSRRLSHSQSRPHGLHRQSHSHRLAHMNVL